MDWVKKFGQFVDSIKVMEFAIWLMLVAIFYALRTIISKLDSINNKLGATYFRLRANNDEQREHEKKGGQ